MNGTDTCTATTAFGAYGIPDGTDLVQRTYQVLTETTDATDASEIRFDDSRRRSAPRSSPSRTRYG